MVEGKAISDATNLSGVGGVRMLAREQLFCEFHGVSAHAAPKVANVIPAYTKVMFTTRSETLKGLKELTSRVVNCVKAGALASGCKVTIETYVWSLSRTALTSMLTLFVCSEPYYADIVLNSPLCDRYQSLGAEIGQKTLSSIPEVLTGSTDAGKSDHASAEHRQLNKGQET
jgi:metal-dependent amidase/aminoacylase/carboxypeptidase family protein